MEETLAGLEGTKIFMDDVLVHAESEELHDQRLAEVLKVIKAAGLKLNRTKCKFKQKQVRFLGHIIDETGIHADPNKVTGIENFSVLYSVHYIYITMLQFNDLIELLTLWFALW